MSSDTDSDRKKNVFYGSPGSPGIVIGKASLFQRIKLEVSSENIDDEDIKHQLKQFKEALEKAEQELQLLLDEQEEGNTLELINMQIEMVNDPDLCRRVEVEIKENNQPADAAIHLVFEDYLAVMQQNQDDVLLDRSVDIVDIRDRLIRFVNDYSKKTKIEEDAILVAEELSPREVIEFSDYNIKGIVMGGGGATSHAAIIARSMNIPAVVGLKKNISAINDGKVVILDGGKGEIIVNPAKSILQKYRKMADRQFEEQSAMEAVCTEPNETTDGHSFNLYANIEFTKELDAVTKYRAEGIGLLRTESVYLRRAHFVDQQKQEEFYETVLKGVDSSPVTIRLFDAGGDKFFNLGQKEQNPFLGWRGIRMLLDEEDLLKNQLKAVLKTAGRHPGRVRILVPMISTLDEVFQIKEIIAEVQSELKKEGAAVEEKVPFGIMVEVPGVALQAEAFAKYTDFLSIGTNDLTQYMLAVDRGNELISKLYNQRHPAMWQIIKNISEAAQKTNTSLAVCGELASDPIAACCLMGLGINELSMTPSLLPVVKKMLRSHSLKQMQKLAEDVLKSETMDDINQIFDDWETHP